MHIFFYCDQHITCIMYICIYNFVYVEILIFEGIDVIFAGTLNFGEFLLFIFEQYYNIVYFVFYIFYYKTW